MSSWFTSALQTVRDKSIDVLDFVRRDLSEFTTTIKNDTESYLNKIANQEVGDLGINRLVSRLSDSGQADNDNGEINQTSTSFDRIHNERTRLEHDESTFLTDPVPIEAYESWLQTSNFNVDAYKGDIAQLLIDAPHVRAIYARLVPAQTTHVNFWSRYYFRLKQIEEDEARRTKLLRRAREICLETSDSTEKTSENDWDEPDDDYPQDKSAVLQESTQEIVPMEQQDSAALNTNLEITTERKESDTSDSWEREFDETDFESSSILAKPDTDLLSKPSNETITSENLSLSTVTATATATSSPSFESDKKAENELDDDWESWS